MSLNYRVIEGVVLEQQGMDWVTGPWRFVFDEHDLNYVLRGPDRQPEGFGSLTAGVRALVKEGRLPHHDGFVPREKVEELVREFERGVLHLIALEVQSAAGYEEGARIAKKRIGELLRKHALEVRYRAYGTTEAC